MDKNLVDDGGFTSEIIFSLSFELLNTKVGKKRKGKGKGEKGRGKRGRGKGPLGGIFWRRQLEEYPMG